MNNPLISIILPTYNGFRYLDQAIEGCLQQTYINWELIIVDDASTDETPQKIAHYISQDSRIQCVRHPQNRRLPAALNSGFARAKGEFLTWTSDDNFYRPDALQEMVVYLQENPQVDVVYTDYSTIDEEGCPVSLNCVVSPDNLIYRNCVGPSFLYRCRVQEETGSYAEDLFLVEDYDFWLRASISFQLKPMHKDLYCYRVHGTSLSALHHERIRQLRDQILGQHLLKIKWLNRNKKGELFLNLARRSWHRRERALALRLMMWAGIYSPSVVTSGISRRFIHGFTTVV